MDGESKMKKLCIHICHKDRPSELALLLQSLRTQTFQDFDIFILDDQSGTPIQAHHFLNCILTRLRLEGHIVYFVRTEFPHGVSKARQRCVDETIDKGYEYFMRLDDDIVLEPEYIDELFEVINKGYNLASGVTVPMAGPTFKREPKFLNGIVNRVILNEEGKYIMNGDDCGMGYTESVILPAHHFRSCLLYESEIHKKGVNYMPTKLSKHGFREEQIFSYKALLTGYTIGVNTGAINYHQQTPSGGERFPEQAELIKYNQEVLEEWTKEHKEELRKLFSEGPTMTMELQKETNMARVC